MLPEKPVLKEPPLFNLNAYMTGPFKKASKRASDLCNKGSVAPCN